MERYADTLVRKVTRLLTGPLCEQKALITVAFSAGQEMEANVLQLSYLTD